MRLSWLLWGVVLAALGGCSDTISVTFVAPAEFQLDSSQAELPPELMQDGRIAEVPCGPMGSCPNPDDSDVTVSCTMADTCDPDPTTLEAPVGDLVDFDMLSTDLQELFTSVDRIEILEASYAVEGNSLSFDLQAAEIYWGPEGATTIDPEMGTQLLGTVPPIPAGSTPSGRVALDPAGQAGLSDHAVGTSRRVRFFARTRVDLDPGDPWPAGSIRGKVELRIRAKGSAL